MAEVHPGLGAVRRRRRLLTQHRRNRPRGRLDMNAES
jgi:hypothetical protein